MSYLLTFQHILAQITDFCRFDVLRPCSAGVCARITDSVVLFLVSNTYIYHQIKRY